MPDTMTLLLTQDEIKALTGKRRSDAQARELAHMGIPYRVRRDGSIAVLLSDVETRPARVREPELMP